MEAAGDVDLGAISPAFVGPADVDTALQGVDSVSMPESVRCDTKSLPTPVVHSLHLLDTGGLGGKNYADMGPNIIRTSR